MNIIRAVCLSVCIMAFSPGACDSQTTNSRTGNQELTNRDPVAAGSYYPADVSELTSLLDQLFSQAEPMKVSGEVLAMLSPHAGYIFSGSVAASSFNQLKKDMEYENIFVIGSSHRVSFDGASIYSKGHYVTPLGTVEVNIDLAEKLIDEHDFFIYHSLAHRDEHSLEVQLPLMQHHFKKDFRIIPIVIGTQYPKTCRKIADALLPYFTSGNLFIISTDFSHYPGYEDAQRVDRLTASSILANSPESLLRILQKNSKDNISGLVTSLCGWSSVLTLLYMTENNPGISIVKVDYKNSGDSEYGKKESVVGYNSICVTKSDTESSGFQLSAKDKEDLLQIARTTMNQYVTGHTLPDFDSRDYSDKLLQPAGAFVTIQKDGALRGCIGQFEPSNSLYLVVKEMAVSSSTKDYRFLPVKPEELPDLNIEISVLSPMRKISSIDEIILGKHGIYIVKGDQSGTFLPQVATQTGWDLEEFLGHCAQDKARLGWDGWKDAEIFIYEAFIFSEDH